MRDLSTATAAATAQVITQPRFLAQIAFNFVARYSSGEDVNWNGLDWLAADIRLGAIQETASGAKTTSLVIGNTDLAFGALCLAQPPQDAPVDIWAWYEGALADDDPVHIFSGSIGDCGITEAAVTLQLSSVTRRSLVIPRRRITIDAGFNHLLPAGRVIQVGTGTYTVERG